MLKNAVAREGEKPNPVVRQEFCSKARLFGIGIDTCGGTCGRKDPDDLTCRIDGGDCVDKTVLPIKPRER
jgi:hypothetical protein